MKVGIKVLRSFRIKLKGKGQEDSANIYKKFTSKIYKKVLVVIF